ncbi:uncharacterized protein [Halyomorpha halys]|uniref:uncharacterized protein n=1 Tax=Halyomorpha halys TaxID=286706 RepID=UPI0034D2CAE0
MPKSYRPIYLLPVASTVQEHMIVYSLRPILSAASRPRQFGSTRDRGTTFALLRVRRDVEESAEKYVLLIMFYTSSALDSVWWFCVLQRLQELGTPNNLYSLAGSYLNNKSVRIRG